MGFTGISLLNRYLAMPAKRKKPEPAPARTKQPVVPKEKDQESGDKENERHLEDFERLLDDAVMPPRSGRKR
jgi:hypothetical protein